MKTLILGGTTEASELAALLAGDQSVQPTLSLAGRTRAPRSQPIPCRVGGFGGAPGLGAYLRAHAIEALIDATHPFAAQISRNAATAAAETGTPVLRVHRPEWTQRPGDRWHRVPDMQTAAAALGAVPRRVLLTVGQQELRPFLTGTAHHYVIRSVDPPATVPAGAAAITARGPFAEAEELALLRAHAIEVLVTKNSGGAATRPKLDAARALGIEVVMVDRPSLPAGVAQVETAAAAAEWLRAQAAVLRGE